MIRRTLLLILAAGVAVLGGCVVINTPVMDQPSAARDLTGTWTGSGAYYQLDLNGNRVLKVTCDVVLKLQQTDNQVNGTLDVYPIKQESTGQGHWVPEVEGHSTVNGDAVITTLKLYIGSKVAGTKEKWEFTFTSDMMSGHVTNLDTTYYAGRDSDANAFKLMRGNGQVPSQTVSSPPPAPDSTSTPISTEVLPSEIPPKPGSLLASNAEYYLIYVVFEDWFGEGSFLTTYNKYSQVGLTSNWSELWIGHEEDESKRIYFDRVGNQWKPRTVLSLPAGTPSKPDSLLASSAEYYFIYVVFEDWFGEGSFITTYNKYSQEGLTSNWSELWIGHVEDESKRIYFDRVEDQWKPRAVPEQSVPAQKTSPQSISAVQVWEIVDETGHIATLTVDASGSFTGSGWVGSTPLGTYDIPITNGVMSGTSMSFSTSASYDSGQGKISGTGSGTLNEAFPSANSASGVWTGTISDPLGIRNFSIKWTATKKSG
jgi:hypothetical protein